METNEIAKKLCEAAVTRETVNLKKAFSDLNNRIGLAGTSESILLKTKDGQELRIYTGQLWDEVVDQLIKKRRNRIEAEAISDFMTKFEHISATMADLMSRDDQ